MSRNVNGTPVICAEPDMICFQCGKVEEVRPYGPNGEELCFACAMKDPFETSVQMGMRLFGETREAAEGFARKKGYAPLGGMR